MSTSTLHQKLRCLVGQRFIYLSETWQLIEILIADDAVVLQREHTNMTAPLQADQFGRAQRRAPETLSLAISDNEGTGYSSELLLLLQGKQGTTAKP